MTTTGDWPDLAGRLVDGGHILPVRVYFEDTDFSGVVYHASYLRFLERGRSDFLRLAGIGHGALDGGAEGERLAFAVRHMELDFLKSARIDDVLEISTRIANISGARIVLHQAALLDGVVIVEATVTVALFNRAGRARRLPEDMRRRLDATQKP